ncbi:MAG TPA: mandelate racemase/muconate lactonizing enzyme family protein [Bryobacterales bacterium]|nr:mandelate racemase/muconate lactonizing enzyme family protein [Bryobacterales bacterium]
MRRVSLVHKRARLWAALQAGAAAQAKGSPAITNIAAHAVREPVSRREYVLAVVETDAGVSGVGEAAATPDAPAVVAALLDQKQKLTGRATTAVEAARLAAGGGDGGDGYAAAAQAAINMALLDITGKLARAPLYEVLGGPTRFQARAAASLWGADDDELRRSMTKVLAAGFRALLVPLARPPFRNQGQAFVRGTRRRLEALRKAAGEQVDFVLDCHGALTPGDAQILAHELETFHLLWLEEPCPALNLSAVAKLAAETVTPIGLGRGVIHNGQFQDLLRLDAIDVLRPDIARHGISQIRKAAAIAETYYVAVAPFHRGGPVATAAALHLAASLPNFFLQEIPFPAASDDGAMRMELATPPVEQARDGYFALPPGPGLGVTLNREALEKYRAA